MQSNTSLKQSAFFVLGQLIEPYYAIVIISKFIYFHTIIITLTTEHKLLVTTQGIDIVCTT